MELIIVKIYIITTNDNNEVPKLKIRNDFLITCYYTFYIAVIFSDFTVKKYYSISKCNILITRKKSEI